MTELADDPLAAGLPPPVSALRRKLELARLVAALIMAEPGLAAEPAAFDLADSLGELLDEMQGEGVPLDALATVDAGEHAGALAAQPAVPALIGDYVAAARRRRRAGAAAGRRRGAGGGLGGERRRNIR